MARWDKITSLFWFCLGLILVIKSPHIGLGSFSNPGPGFIFFWGGIFLCSFSVIVFIIAYSQGKKGGGKSISWEGIRWRMIICLNIFLLIFAYLLEKIGYILSILLLMLFLFKVMGSQKWHIAIISTILCTLFVYAIFVLGLKSQLPRGILPF